MTAVAYPFVTVTTDDSGLRPTMRRAPGVLAVVGPTATGADGGAAEANVPEVVRTRDRAGELFSKKDAHGVIAPNTLFSALELAFLQNPGPSKIYGVRTGEGGTADALAALQGADDVTFVVLATPATAAGGAAGGTALDDLKALKKHVDNVSAGGNKCLGVAMVDPAVARSAAYVATVSTAMKDLAGERMVVVAARGATGDVAVASAAAMAGYPPSVSIVLKPVAGLTLPLAGQFGPDEITGLAEKGIVPIIDPALISGDSLHFAEGAIFKAYKPGDQLAYVDTVRTLDDIDYRLKAGLIGLIGDARITRSGLTLVKARIEGILGTVQREGALDGFRVSIPVLDVLNVPEGSRAEPDKELLKTARDTRTVPVRLEVVLGRAVHRLDILLAAS